VTAEEKYVAAAYLAVFLFVLVYVLIMATKIARLEREVAELTERARHQERPPIGRARHELTEEAAKPPVREGGPVEGVRGNREVPPVTEQGARG
jgi:CcmD family protein